MPGKIRIIYIGKNKGFLDNENYIDYITDEIACFFEGEVKITSIISKCVQLYTKNIKGNGIIDKLYRDIQKGHSLSYSGYLIVELDTCDLFKLEFILNKYDGFSVENVLRIGKSYLDEY